VKVSELEHTGVPSGPFCDKGPEFCSTCERGVQAAPAIQDLAIIDDLILRYQSTYGRGFTGDRDLLAVTNDMDDYMNTNQEDIFAYAFQTGWSPVSRGWDGEMYECSQDLTYRWAKINKLDKESQEQEEEDENV
jgi:hypothetical protein